MARQRGEHSKATRPLTNRLARTCSAWQRRATRHNASTAQHKVQPELCDAFLLQGRTAKNPLPTSSEPPPAIGRIDHQGQAGALPHRATLTTCPAAKPVNCSTRTPRRQLIKAGTGQRRSGKGCRRCDCGCFTPPARICQILAVVGQSMYDALGIATEKLAGHSLWSRRNREIKDLCNPTRHLDCSRS